MNFNKIMKCSSKACHTLIRYLQPGRDVPRSSCQSTSFSEVGQSSFLLSLFASNDNFSVWKDFLHTKKQRNYKLKSSLVSENFVLSCLSETFNKNTITTSLALSCHLRGFDCLLPCCQSFSDGRALL